MMRSDKLKTILMSGIMAAAMVLTPVSAMAAGLSAKEPTLTKTVKVADGVKIPENTVFTVTQDTNEDGTESPAAKESTWTVEANTKDGTSTSGSYTPDAVNLGIAGNLAEKSGTDTALAAGEYTFKVEETAPSKASGDYGWIGTDSSVYYVHVYVKNDGSVQYSATKGLKTGDKADITFENTYTAASTLTVTKKVENPDYADADTKYNFHITFTKAEPNTGVVTIGTGADAKAVDYGKSYDFSLQKDGAVTFHVPAGTTYSLTEDTAKNVESTTFEVNDAKADSVKDVLVKEGNDNKAVVTNTYQKITPTGIITSVAPAIALIAAAVAAVVLYASLKRKAAR